MATYSATNYDRVPVSSHGFGADAKCAFFQVATTAALTTADVINFGYLPANARVLLAVFEATDLDTNGTPTLAINVGDSGSAARYFSASTVGQAATLSTAIATPGAGYKTTAKTLIVGAPSTNAATGVAGTLYLSLFYVVD